MDEGATDSQGASRCGEQRGRSNDEGVRGGGGGREGAMACGEAKPRRLSLLVMPVLGNVLG